MTSPFYAAQDAYTTVAYLDGVSVCQESGNTVAIEQAMKDGVMKTGAVFIERVIFGAGRVAMIFRTPMAWR